MNIETTCAICHGRPASSVVYPERLDSASFTPDVFSARRTPDRRYYQWVRCSTCGLMRSDPVRDVDLAELYADSTFDYSGEVSGLSATYAHLLDVALQGEVKRGTLVEIGGGNGFFLDAVAGLGFEQLIEVEPSRQALENATPLVKERAICNIMHPGLFDEGTVDVVVMFHVLDHLPDPRGVLEAVYAALRPGGTVLIAVHDVEAWSARLFRNRSPIFDVEHTYLYSRTTGPELLRRVGFAAVRSGAYRNCYSGAYLLHLLPFPLAAKRMWPYRQLSAVAGRFSVNVPLGNMWMAACRPT